MLEISNGHLIATSHTYFEHFWAISYSAFFQNKKKFQRIFFSYTITKDGEEKITCKIRKKNKEKKRASAISRRKMKILANQNSRGSHLFLSKALFFLAKTGGGLVGEIGDYMTKRTIILFMFIPTKYE